jgi:NADPH-dependent ferric siderophore reductase
MVRITLGGSELDGLVVEQPAASVRMVVPWPGEELVIPDWTGNEFLLPDGRRPALRTFTPRRLDPDALELDIDIVLHGPGAVSEWAAGVAVGDAAAVSGPARGYVVDPESRAFLLGGDETAIPAIGQVLAALPAEASASVYIEIADAGGRQPLPDHPGAVVTWCELPAGAPPGDALVAAVQGAELAPDVRVWVAGEAAAVQRIRRYLFEERGLSRRDATVRGYWKFGRSGGADDD